MKRYYDPEHDRIIDENEVRKQYTWFAQQAWFRKTFKQFAEDNFVECKDMTSEEILEITEVVARNHGIEDMDRIEEMAGAVEVTLDEHYNGPINDEIVAQVVEEMI